jgi:hypothetical protein
MVSIEMISMKEIMKKVSARVISIGIVIVFVLCLLSPTAIASGIGVAPSTLEIEEVMRGSEFERLILVFNPGEEVSGYALNATGDAMSWISFAERYTETPIERITVPAGGEASVLVKITVPPDAPNGEHEATIVVTGAPVEGEEGGTASAVALSATVHVTIAVTGTQILAGEVIGISTRDTEVGYPQWTEVVLQNTGNVVATPQIDVEITKDGKFIDSLTFAEAEVGVESLETITMEWNTTGNELGDYSENVTVLLGGEVLATEDLQFKLLPVGTLSRQGSLTDISYEGEPSVDKTVKILVTFANTGEIDTKAKFIGEVYVDGDLVDTISSEELLVPVRETGTLTAYLKIEKGSSYTIKGHALYEGKTTETKELSFDVGTEPESTPDIPGFGAIGAVIAVAILVFTWNLWKKRSSKA